MLSVTAGHRRRRGHGNIDTYIYIYSHYAIASLPPVNILPLPQLDTVGGGGTEKQVGFPDLAEATCARITALTRWGLTPQGWGAASVPPNVCEAGGGEGGVEAKVGLVGCGQLAAQASALVTVRLHACMETECALLAQQQTNAKTHKHSHAPWPCYCSCQSSGGNKTEGQAWGCRVISVGVGLCLYLLNL